MNKLAKTDLLMHNLFALVEVVGVDATNKILETQLSRKHSDNPTAKFVLDEVSKELNLAVTEILYGSGRKNDRYFALGFCCHYLHDHYEYDMEKVEIFVGQTISVCYKTYKLIKNLTPGNPRDDEYLIKRTKLDSVILPDVNAKKPKQKITL